MRRINGLGLHLGGPERIIGRLPTHVPDVARARNEAASPLFDLSLKIRTALQTPRKVAGLAVVGIISHTALLSISALTATQMRLFRRRRFTPGA